MVVYPNCKINLGLHIVDKRSDGYHNIETVFYPLSLCDILEINRCQPSVVSYQLSVTVNEKLKTENGELTTENLCIKAYKLLAKEYELPPVAIHLHKGIPLGAGLGGGSSDAAYTIKLLNNLFALNLSDNKMEYFASQIGSDCAFFIQNKPVFASGRGDKFSDIRLRLKNYYILIIKPDVNINTQLAYSLISQYSVLSSQFSLRDIVKKPISAWKGELINDFEKPMFCEYPQLKEIKESLYKEGAIYASMTGSGSAIYGIFENEPKIVSGIGYRVSGNKRNFGFVWKGILG